MNWIHLCELELVLLFQACLLISAALDSSDYYGSLGVSRDASEREIRKAFKKLALEHHPDKHSGEARDKAHDTFVKLNEMYEVLKDPDKRKIYDVHGEEGLKEEKQGGRRRYESWSFFQNEFGLYDDDEEITTFDSYEQFQTTVDTPGEVWFVNFYSPRCSHCHDLAPDWRSLARDMQGAVNFAAVNCADQRRLCNNVNVRGYPTLILYPGGKVYNGNRSPSDLTKFITSNVKSRVIDLSKRNFGAYLSPQSRGQYTLPFIVTFCDNSGDCIGRNALVRLSLMLKSVAFVAYFDCSADGHDEWCSSRFGLSAGTRYFPDISLTKSSSREVSSLDASEVVAEVLDMLPPVPESDATCAGDLWPTATKGRVLFMHTGDIPTLQLVELMKLALTSSSEVEQVNCRDRPTLCRELHVTRFPQIVAVKPTRHVYEVYHGRVSAGAVNKFVTSSLKSTLSALTPSTFPKNEELDKWLIDFYSPACAPCLSLLPVVRSLAARNDVWGVRFGTVDCTAHRDLCNKAGVKQYPTTILYNQTSPFRESGYKDESELREFISDILTPSVVVLTYSSFRDQVLAGSRDKVWAVDFFAPWCGPCMQIAPTWRRVARTFAKSGNAVIGSVDCTVEERLCEEQGVRGYPTLRAYPVPEGGQFTHTDYNSWFTDQQSITQWVMRQLPRNSQDINKAITWAQIRANKGPDIWVVDFHAERWCAPCRKFSPNFEELAKLLKKHKIRAGKINCERTRQWCTEARITGYPSVVVFGGDGRTVREIDTQDPHQMLSEVLALTKTRRHAPKTEL